jgi:putative endonuclease
MLNWFRAKKPADHLALGRWGEQQAARFLRRQGWRILERNYASAHGEIDLIADDHGTLVFVEVRTRSSNSFGDGEQSVDRRKERHIEHAARQYLRAWPRAECPHRFDIIAIEVSPEGRLVQLEHYPSAF